ncbi:MAG: ATP-binding cassette domain-containing protein [Acidimicrobiales bacterium]|nr:ATP-binding cassette domain-containing protein [Acidimicrobiales bacterium]HRW36109.1 ATP-binding cassette domain-containing protein [Aquihabitans sp.]
MRRERPLIAVAAEAITKAYGKGSHRVVALDGASFEARSGEVVALLGRNGAGKSSLLRILSGRDHADAGRATVFGLDVNRQSHLVAPLTGVLVDRPGFLGGLSVQANLELVARRRGLSGAASSELLERCGLHRAARGRMLRACSLGMRQRLGIAAALIGGPPLLMLDEPTNGLDPGGIAWVRELIRGHADGGGVVLLASHLLGEVEAVADQVVVLQDGRVVRRGSPAALARSVVAPMRLRTTSGPAARKASSVLTSIGVEVVALHHEEVQLRPSAAQLDRLSLVLASEGVAVVALEPMVSPLEALLDARETG